MSSGKYTSSNRKLRRLIFEQTGLTVLKHDDPRIMGLSEIAGAKKRIPARELARQYRHYCNRLMTAYYDYNRNVKYSLEEIALRNNVCKKLLVGVLQQHNTQVRAESTA